MDHHLVFVDAAGELLARVEAPGGGLDDTGHSRNLTSDARVILTAPLHEVSVLDDHGFAVSLGDLGLDIAPPAVAPDGMLVVADFSKAALVAIDPVDGSNRAQRFRRGRSDADRERRRSPRRRLLARAPALSIVPTKAHLERPLGSSRIAFSAKSRPRGG